MTAMYIINKSEGRVSVREAKPEQLGLDLTEYCETGYVENLFCLTREDAEKLKEYGLIR